MALEPKFLDLNCVLVGNFNPAIFHPEWFRKNGLFRDEEIDLVLEEPKDKDSKNRMFFLSDFSQFNVTNIGIRVELDRFQALTGEKVKFPILRDVVAGSFKILDQTPIRAMGINIRGDYEFESKTSWDQISELLGPKEPWTDILGETDLSSFARKGGNPWDKDGYIRIRVEPSNKFDFGIFVDINNHFNLENKETSQMVEILHDKWEEIIKTSIDSMGKFPKLI